MIYYYGFPIGKNLGDDAVYLSFLDMIDNKYKNLITFNENNEHKVNIIGGGSLIAQNKAHSGVCQIKLNKPTFFFGTGFDEIPGLEKDWDYDYVRDNIEEKNVFVRGNITRAKLGGYGHVVGDPAYNKNILMCAMAQPGQYKYGISFGDGGNRSLIDVDKTIKDVFSKINPVETIGIPVCIEDIKFMEKYMANVMQYVLGWPEYVRFLKENIKEFHCMKLHSQIAADLAGVKTYKYNYRLKCTDTTDNINMELLKTELNRFLEENLC